MRSCSCALIFLFLVVLVCLKFQEIYFLFENIIHFSIFYIIKIYYHCIIESINTEIFVWSIYFLLWCPFKLPDFIMVDMSLWWSERYVSKLGGNLDKFGLLVRIRSMHVGFIDWKQVGLLMRHDNANISIKSLN